MGKQNRHIMSISLQADARGGWWSRMMEDEHHEQVYFTQVQEACKGQVWKDSWAQDYTYRQGVR